MNYGFRNDHKALKKIISKGIVDAFMKIFNSEMLSRQPRKMASEKNDPDLEEVGFDLEAPIFPVAHMLHSDLFCDD